jgi:hypothetical protein
VVLRDGFGEIVEGGGNVRSGAVNGFKRSPSMGKLPGALISYWDRRRPHRCSCTRCQAVSKPLERHTPGWTLCGRQLQNLGTQQFGTTQRDWTFHGHEMPPDRRRSKLLLKLKPCATVHSEDGLLTARRDIGHRKRTLPRALCSNFLFPLQNGNINLDDFEDQFRTNYSQ